MNYDFPSIKCPKCLKVSYDENDIKHKFCGACNEWHSHMISKNLLTSANRDNLIERYLAQDFLINYIEIKLDKGSITIEKRPMHCDRGRYIAKVYSDCVKTFYVDRADMFPRYYFLLDTCLSELDLWLAARKVNVIKILKNNVGTT